MTVPANPGSGPDCKCGFESDNTCSGLQRLVKDLGIKEGRPDKINTTQIAEDISPVDAAALIEAHKGIGRLAIQASRMPHHGDH